MAVTSGLNLGCVVASGYRDLRHSDIPKPRIPSPYRSDDASDRGANQMSKFYALIAACAVFAPMAFATLNQAAQIVA
jgi:hypothetical protein